MSYNNPRITYSKFNCICTVCNKKIHKGEQIYLDPPKKITIHIKCKNDKT